MKAVSAAVLALAAGASLATFIPTADAQTKEPPSCSAITFRPLGDSMADGEQDAGMYRSRFGRIVVKAQVKGGRAETYFVTVNNNRPTNAAYPASVTSCASTKKLPAPAAAAAQSCLGDRFQVLVNHSGDKRYVALYARDGSRWTYCGGGVA